MKHSRTGLCGVSFGDNDMIILGIDPGASGAIGMLRYENGTLEGIGAMKLDVTERDISDYFAYQDRPLFAFIERVHSMPKQGVASSFKFGVSYGFLRGCLIAHEIPFEEVTPQKWQKFMGCLSRGDKNVTKAKAQQLFPEIKITHAVADALLIAEYGRRIRSNGKS